MINTVTKADGTLVPFDADKMNRWGEWAAEKCGISWSSVVIHAVNKCYDGISTKDLQQALIQACVDERTTGHLKMAARLLVGDLYKDVYGGIEVPSFAGHANMLMAEGIWCDMPYTLEELEHCEAVITHGMDFTMSYSAVRQYIDKYAVRDLLTGKIYETPQVSFMGMAMYLFQNEEPEVRMGKVFAYYERLALGKINLPTPVLNGARTGENGFASCCVITGGDSAGSNGAATGAAYDMTALKAGIGAELDLRSILDPVRGGRVVHGGKLNYYKHLDTAVKANTQVTRGGSATVTFKVFDPEIEMLLRLKGQRTSEDKRLPFMDYSLAFNRTFLKHVAMRKDWMLVSKFWAPQLHDMFYWSDTSAFEREYARVAADPSIPKTFVSAMDIAMLHVNARVETGRNYRCSLHNINSHTPFLDAIRLSNLCQEIALPTKEFKSYFELANPNAIGEIALCFLSAIVVSKITDDNDYAFTAYLVLNALDNMIELMDYPYESLRVSAQARRSVGVGMTGVAHEMALRGLKYDTEEGRNYIHFLAERHSYHLHMASAQLAMEKGHCEWIHKTKYDDENPWTPLETYCREIDKYHTAELAYDWSIVTEAIAKFGVRFSVLEAHMPCESSSVFTDTTNGVYPVRQLQIIKTSRKGTVFFQVPDYDDLKDSYQLAWDIETRDMLIVYGIIQKFTGQSISADEYWDFNKGNPSMKDQLQLWMFGDKIGVKTVYYFNSEVSTGGSVHNLVAAEEDEEGCDNCTL